MSDALGQDQFQPVNRRAGYGDALEMALSAARKGWTLSAGQGALIVEHYEEKLAAVIGERERFMHRMYEARDDADRAERQFNIVTDMLVEQASLLTHYEEKLAAVREAASLVCETAVEVQGMSYCEVYTTHVDALCAAAALTQENA
jgi:prophage DNA circulation protein